MYTRKKNRILLLSFGCFVVFCGMYIILSNLRDNIVFFYPPSELYKISDIKKKFRVGGKVKKNSVNRILPNKISFTITDTKSELIVEYEGILPALFREDQGIVAEGVLSIDRRHFYASQLLTKHDENYKPPQ